MSNVKGAVGMACIWAGYSDVTLLMVAVLMRKFGRFDFLTGGSRSCCSY